MTILAGLSPVGALIVRAGEPKVLNISLAQADGATPQNLQGRTFALIVRRSSRLDPLFRFDAELSGDGLYASFMLTAASATAIFEAGWAQALSYDIVELTGNASISRFSERVTVQPAPDLLSDIVPIWAMLPYTEAMIRPDALVISERGAQGDGTPALEAAATALAAAAQAVGQVEGAITELGEFTSERSAEIDAALSDAGAATQAAVLVVQEQAENLATVAAAVETTAQDRAATETAKAQVEGVAVEISGTAEVVAQDKQATASFAAQASAYRDQAGAIKDQTVAAAATPALAIQTNLSTPTVPPAGVANLAHYWAAGTDRLTLYKNTAGVGEKVNPEVTAPLGSVLDAIPVKKTTGPNAVDFVGRRRRRFGFISGDGRLFNLSGMVLQRLASAVRITSASGLGRIDVNDDGSVGLPGHLVTARAAPWAWGIVGKRRRLIAKLTGNEFFAHGMRVARSGSDLDLSLDGRLVVRVSNRGVPQFTGLSGGVGAVSTSDTYKRDGQLAPVVTNLKKWAIWGSSTASYLGDNFSALAAKRGATAFLGGRGSERIEHHAARLGSRPALLNFPGNTVPGSGSVTLATPSNWTIVSALLPYDGTVGVGGVEGTLEMINSGTVRFTRTTAGDPVAVPANVPFIPTVGMASRADFNLLNFGKNSISAGRSSTDIVQICIDADNYLTPLIGRSLWLNHFIDSDETVNTTQGVGVLAVNAGLKSYFGDRLIDMYGFVCLGLPMFGKTVWQVTGITPTADDLLKQSQGLKPMSISRDAGHLNDVGDEAIMWLLDQTQVARGYYPTLVGEL